MFTQHAKRPLHGTKEQPVKVVIGFESATSLAV